MQAISDVISPIVKIAQPLVQGFGLVSNLIQGHRAAGLQSTAINNVNQLSQLAANPAALAARIQQLQQPLNRGLLSGVGNEVQGYLAERGLGLSPSISAEVLGQALGPYQLQEQEIASRLALEPYRDLGYLTEAAQRTGPGIANTTGFWNSLSQLSTGGAGRPQISPSGSLPGQAYPSYMPNPSTPYNPNLPSYENPIPYQNIDPFAENPVPPDIQFPGSQFPDLGGS